MSNFSETAVKQAGGDLGGLHLTNSWRAIVPVAVTALLALTPAPAGLAQHAWYYFAIFAGVIVALISEPLPGAAVGLIGVAVVTALAPTVLYGPAELAKAGVNPADAAMTWALAGFSNATVWLIFAAFLFALAYEKCGNAAHCDAIAHLLAVPARNQTQRGGPEMGGPRTRQHGRDERTGDCGRCACDDCPRAMDIRRALRECDSGRAHGSLDYGRDESVRLGRHSQISGGVGTRWCGLQRSSRLLTA